mgnify:CR=1 FL=1
MESNNSIPSKNKKKWPLAISLFVFSVFLIYFMIYKPIQQKKQDTIIRMQYIEEKNALRDDLDDLIDEHDDLLLEYGNLNNQLRDKDSIIKNQISEIRNLIRTKQDLSEAKRKIALLKVISKRYLSNIDSLLVINKSLLNEKDSVIKVNRNINWKNYKLNKENIALTNKVNQGSVLEIKDLIVQTLKYRSSGREVETKKASKTVIIRTHFEIQHNLLADKGIRNIYIRYIDYKGDVLINNSDEQSFIVDGVEKEYSVFKQVQYDNKLLPISIDFQRRDKLTQGDYKIEIYVDGILCSQNTFYLK